MTIAIVLDNGKEIRTKCEEFNMSRSMITGKLDDMSFDGISENKPLYVDVDHVVMVYRVLGDEESAKVMELIAMCKDSAKVVENE